MPSRMPHELGDNFSHIFLFTQMVASLPCFLLSLSSDGLGGGVWKGRVMGKVMNKETGDRRQRFFREHEAVDFS